MQHIEGKEEQPGSGSVQLLKLPELAGVEAIYLVDGQGRELPANASMELTTGDAGFLQVRGRFTGGEEFTLDPEAVGFVTCSDAANISRSGQVLALRIGAARVYAETEKPEGSKLRTPDLWIIVQDPGEFCKPWFICHTSLEHPAMDMEIGQPAVLAPGDLLPTVTIEPMVNSTVSVALLREGTPTGISTAPCPIPAGERHRLALPGHTHVEKQSRLTLPGSTHAGEKGEYELRLTLTTETGDTYTDSYYFTVMDEEDVPPGQSRVAYLDQRGKLRVVPDYRGNRILDFSGAGYRGGGVQLPDVQVMAVVEPAPGDATARIQAAIDAVSQLPADAMGLRGAVLLRKGSYNIAGTLLVHTGGVVLRGEGSHAEGTVLRATGAVRRNVLEIGSGAGPAILPGTEQDITDLYVPSGARTFRVADASQYKAGDTVLVRRVGNDRWLHEIGMDAIYMRPGTDGSSTRQWEPFDLDFDRVITAVNGCTITVDVPIANAIERKWGGGRLYKYTDGERIEQAGVENMQVVSDFDPAVLSTVMDNGRTYPYYADEEHAERFVVFNSVKNGWARDLAGFHLSYALVQLGRFSKWITVQDCFVSDMVSIVTGGRRYSIYVQGQQHLVQRIYAETARHAFIYDSAVAGPNVVLDSESYRDYNTSEPHHRWSAGGLFDQVKAPVSIRDRGWLGSGHGWSGANYVNWNTEGKLTSQQPPTAQNYVIGHVGPKTPPLLPNAYDPRPRRDAYWESHGKHVAAPASLYKQQLAERLGPQAVANLAKLPYGDKKGSADRP
jgi:hypothetical protein